MTTRKHVRRACARVLLCATLAALAFAAVYSPRPSGASAAGNISRARQDGGRLDIRLRSLTTRATGRLTVEPSEGGGRVRMTALNLPDPRTVTPGANTYVVWAVSGGRILRLGELKRDERGNGGLAFERPEGFERYGVIVTAEPDANAERPGDPVLTTRADEASALYPTPAPAPADTADSDKSPEPTTTATPNVTSTPTTTSTPDTTPAPSTSTAPTTTHAVRERTRASNKGVSAPSSPSRAVGFYAEVEDAIAASGGGRVVELEGDSLAPGAGGAARTAYQRGHAYVRANFRGVPLPSAVGAGVYVLWGVLADGRIVYMGSLPATDDLNCAEVYVRVPGFDADDYTLFVTAEPARPAPAPSSRRVLRPTNASFVIK
ncbi:MAG TPA: hypothetical protein VGP08_14255 [Pyrinomonadaceae bacterium]|jgi:hypothetical protein|nr:hypothetical protein [Pyrinomonadaceae bacterium]